MFPVRITQSLGKKKCFVYTMCLALMTVSITYVSVLEPLQILQSAILRIVDTKNTLAVPDGSLDIQITATPASDLKNTSLSIKTETTHRADVLSMYNNNVTYDFDVKSFLIKHNVTDDSQKKIFLWFYPVSYTFRSPKPIPLRVCSDMPCLVTTNKEFFNKSDVIFFSAVDMSADRKTLTIPPNRTKSDQLFLLHGYEPQRKSWIWGTSFRQPGWKSAFNLTVGYRSDSDIFVPYGTLIPRTQLLEKDYTSVLANKSGLTAWMVSNCNTEGKREKYVEALRKHVTVDIYGGCGRHKCERGKDDDCLREIGQRYKFYLSFESVICPDYISEKFFHYYKLDLVLIYFGTDDIYRFVPSGTYINVKDFSSAENLAKHLLYLDSHTDEYIRLLEAKNRYLSRYEFYPHLRPDGSFKYIEFMYQAVPLCELCRKLWEKDPSLRKTIPDIIKWFDKGNCLATKD